jgi:SAM-dependent methyltransferase
MITPPRRATWQRWRSLANTRYSILRSLEYEAIKSVRLKGRTLDLGGGRLADYRSFLQTDGTIDGLNLYSSLQPTICADANDSWPLEANVYDNVISLNTLEHLARDEFALSESLRVLKPGGAFHAVIPFLYRVHGSPSDYHRHTAFWWRDTLLSLGIAAESLVVEPLLWDPYSSAYSLIEFNFWLLRGITKRLTMLYGVLRQLRWSGERMPDSHAAAYQEFALGYYVHGTKAGKPVK